MRSSKFYPKHPILNVKSITENVEDTRVRTRLIHGKKNWIQIANQSNSV